MTEQMLIFKKEDLTPDQLIIILNQIDKEIDAHSRVSKAKHDMAKALCEINSIDELNDVVSHFICCIVPIFRNNIAFWNMNKEKILELLKRD